jgi:hypothetical protein
LKKRPSTIAAGAVAVVVVQAAGARVATAAAVTGTVVAIDDRRDANLSEPHREFLGLSSSLTNKGECTGLKPRYIHLLLETTFLRKPSFLNPKKFIIKV